MKYGSLKHLIFVLITYGLPLLYVVASLKFIAWDNIEGLLIAIGLWAFAYCQFSVMVSFQRFDDN